MNGLKPASIQLDNIYADVDSHSVIVVVDEDQQSLAIGKKGQNVRLASRLCGWDIDIKTREEFEAEGFTRAESTPEEGGTADSDTIDSDEDEPTAARSVSEAPTSQDA